MPYSKIISIGLCLAVLLSAPSVTRAQTGAGASTLSLTERVSALLSEITRFKERLALSAGRTVLSDTEVTRIIRASTAWLLAAQEADGHFRYEYVPYENRYLAGDNSVRQAGTFYQLGEVLRHGAGDDAAIEAAMVRSIDYFTGLTRDGVSGTTTFRCVAEPTDETHCKLGTTALVLVGMMSLVEHNSDYRDDYKERIEAYASFVQAMHKSVGGFRANFYHGRIPEPQNESSYATGEALLALVRYQEYRPTPKTQQAIETTFTYIRDVVPFDSALYLWAMAAVADMYADDPRADYAAYVRAYTDWRMSGFVGRRGTSHNMCAYTEGLALAYGVLKSSLPSAASRPYRDELRVWLAKGSALQIDADDRYRVAFGGGIPTFLILANEAQARGGFLTGESELTQRIDFTQHCLNSYLVWAAVQ